MNKKITITVCCMIAVFLFSQNKMEQDSPNYSAKKYKEDRHLFYKGNSVTIYVDKVLYEIPSSPNFWLRFIIENNTYTRLPLYFNLENTHQHIYPNQWGIYTNNTRQEINEKQIIPLSLDSLKKKVYTEIEEKRTSDVYKRDTIDISQITQTILDSLNKNLFPNLLSEFKHILPNGALEYFVEFNGGESSHKGNIKLKQGEFFIVSLDGQLAVGVFDKIPENITCDGKTIVNRELVLPYPIQWKTIPLSAQKINFLKPPSEKITRLSTYESGIGIFYRPIGKKFPFLEMVNGNQHISDLQFADEHLNILVESDYPKDNYYLAQVPWKIVHDFDVKNIADYYYKSSEDNPYINTPFSKSPLKEKIPENFYSSQAFKLLKEKQHNKLELVKVIEISKGLYMVGLSYPIQKNEEQRGFGVCTKIILISDTDLYYEILFDAYTELVSFDIRDNYMLVALNSDKGYKDGELMLPMLTTQVFLIDMTTISGNIEKE